MDAYDPDTVFSSIDQMGRYAYKNQPMIAQWNFGAIGKQQIATDWFEFDHAIEVAKDQPGIDLQILIINAGPIWWKANLALLITLMTPKLIITRTYRWGDAQHRPDYTRLRFSTQPCASGAPQDLCNPPQFSDCTAAGKHD